MKLFGLFLILAAMSCATSRQKASLVGDWISSCDVTENSSSRTKYTFTDDHKLVIYKSYFKDKACKVRFTESDLAAKLAALTTEYSAALDPKKGREMAEYHIDELRGSSLNGAYVLGGGILASSGEMDLVFGDITGFVSYKIEGNKLLISSLGYSAVTRPLGFGDDSGALTRIPHQTEL